MTGAPGRARGKVAAPTTRIPPLEWAVAAVGALLVAGTFALLLHQGLEPPGEPPAVAVEVESVVPREGRYLVRFRAVNGGAQTAGGLVVEGRLTRGPGAGETSWTTLPYLPPRSERSGGLFFEHDPGAGGLVLRPVGYEAP